MMSTSRRALSLSVASFALAMPIVVSCSGTTDNPDDDGALGGSGGVSNTGGTASGTGGASGAATGGSPTGGATTGGAPTGGSVTGGASGTSPTGGGAGISGAAGSSTTGGSAGSDAGGTAGTGAGGMGGAPGGMGGKGGMGVAGSFVPGGMGGGAPVQPLDCGGKGSVVENAGPPANRANYVIIGDGYSAADLMAGGAFDTHITNAMNKRFGDVIGQPYKRYRKFVNVCGIKLVSTPICGSSLLGCCGNDSSRLASCNNSAVTTQLNQNLPASFEADFRAVMLNGSSWWNSGGALMYFSGGNRDAGGAALHEGGHGHHALSDEYGNCEQSRVSREATYGVNVSLSGTNSGDKWTGWMNYNDNPGTGMQGFFACDGNATWRPSSNSMMNSLFGTNVNTSFNPVSREKIVMDIWRAVQTPWDSVVPAAGAVMNPTTLTVNVIDPAVINVDWSVDGRVVATNGGPTYNVGAAGLASGTHMITARAYDNAGPELVKQVPGTTFNRQYWGSGAMGHSDKTVTWNVTIP